MNVGVLTNVCLVVPYSFVTSRLKQSCLYLTFLSIEKSHKLYEKFVRNHIEFDMKFLVNNQIDKRKLFAEARCVDVSMAYFDME